MREVVRDAGQLELFPIQPVVRWKDLSIDERFLAFHEANPHVYRNLKSLAMQLKKTGRSRFSITLLVEKLRWEYLTSTRHADDSYMINNDYSSRYARLLMEEPGLAGMFAVRSLRGERE